MTTPHKDRLSHAPTRIEDMTNGNSAELKPSQKWTERKKAVTEWKNKIACHGGRNVTTREIACFEDGFEAAREALSVCADGGKGEAVYQVSSEGRFWQTVSKPVWINWQADYRNILYTAPQAECAPRECRHCGWMCIPNSTPSKSMYPLAAPTPERAQESAGVRLMDDEVIIPADLLTEMIDDIQDYFTILESVLAKKEGA